MGVKLNKLWNNNKFISLSNDSKLLYLYLCSNSAITSIGVLNTSIDMISLQTTLSLSQIRKSSKELLDKGYLYVGKHDDELYFVVIEHFNSLPKSESTVLKVTNELKSLPVSLQLKLESIGISINKKVVQFVKPSLEEVNNYAFSMGYLFNAQEFIDFYEETALRYGRTDIWLDSRGKQVKDWKGKLRKVWFKNATKLVSCDGAPKGFEYFYIESAGEFKTPDGWKDGKPFSRNFILNKELQKAYEERKKNS